MVREIKINSLRDITKIADVTRACRDDIGVHDSKGAIADAKSILGLMCLDFTNPVKLVSENSHELSKVFSALS